MVKDYNVWLEKAKGLEPELATMSPEDIENAFHRDLAFGTGGLRGIIGAGTNRMNIYTVAKASQGLSNYVNENFKSPSISIAVSYDSRIMSDAFAKVASGVFAANGIHVYMYKQLMPTPCLSYAVRYLRCVAGIMITASHNPSKYNGYKVYGPDGCQITTKAASEILAEIEKTDAFDDVNRRDFESAINRGEIEYISDDVYTSFVEEVKRQTVLKDEDIDRSVSIVYSPLNGTGLKPVLRVLSENGYSNISVVPEQEKPDGNFPTCPYPNPEIKEAMQLGMEYAEKRNADLLLATDPDCDRVGIAVKNDAGEFQLISGNEVGCLLLDFICDRRIANGIMPENPVFIKTIVTADMGRQIANNYGVTTIDVLTGFKYIGEQLGDLEKQGREKDYICGFEESYGYLTGTYVRDKDAVNGASMICEMFAYYKSQGISLLQKLEELYQKYGYRLNTLHSYEFEGKAGFDKMQSIMQCLRGEIAGFGGVDVKETVDYSQGIGNLPKSDVLKYQLSGGSSVVIRPSGTEPKLKAYISVTGTDMDEARKIEASIVQDLKKYGLK